MDRCKRTSRLENMSRSLLLWPHCCESLRRCCQRSVMHREMVAIIPHAHVYTNTYTHVRTYLQHTFTLAHTHTRTHARTHTHTRISAHLYDCQLFTFDNILLWMKIEAAFCFAPLFLQLSVKNVKDIPERPKQLLILQDAYWQLGQIEVR